MVSERPRKLAKALVRFLRKKPEFGAGDVRVAMARLRRQRRRRGDPPGRHGHEHAVECLLRPKLANYVRKRWRLTGQDLPATVQSSHFHSSNYSEEAWKKLWLAFRAQHPDVDTGRHRADLFVATRSGELVSFEFKYCGPRRTPSVKGCVRQMRRYLRKHGASVLVIYAARHVSDRLAEKICAIRNGLPARRAFVVDLSGPRVRFRPYRSDSRVNPVC